MCMNFKKIIREEVDDFEWIRDVNPTNFTLVPKELENYLTYNGRKGLWSTMNTLINDKTKDWYGYLGEFAYNYYKQSGKNDQAINVYINLLDDALKTKVRRRSPYGMFGIYMLTALDHDVLKKMFGDEPIYHDHFGEGFDGEYNEELDTFDEPEIGESYASYFVEVNGYLFHLGYDHRGISIEVPSNLSAKIVAEKIMKPIIKSYIDNL